MGVASILSNVYTINKIWTHNSNTIVRILSEFALAPKHAYLYFNIFF